MALGLSSTLSKTGFTNPVAGIVTDSLVLKHNYAAGGVSLVSDGAASLDGTDDYIALGSDVVITDDQFTLMGWYNFNSFSGNPHLFSDSSTTDKYIRVKSDGSEIYLETDSNADDATFVLSSALTTGRWYHIALTRNDETWGGYIDGVFKAFYDTTSGNNSLTIDRLGGARFLNGYMCNVGIWSAVLTQAQIKSIMWKNYAGLTSSETDNLVSWWNLDEADGSTVEDLHGSNDGTLT